MALVHITMSNGREFFTETDEPLLGRVIAVKTNRTCIVFNMISKKGERRIQLAPVEDPRAALSTRIYRDDFFINGDLVMTAVELNEGGALWKYFHQVVGNIVLPGNVKAD